MAFPRVSTNALRGMVRSRKTPSGLKSSARKELARRNKRSRSAKSTSRRKTRKKRRTRRRKTKSIKRSNTRKSSKKMGKGGKTKNETLFQMGVGAGLKGLVAGQIKRAFPNVAGQISDDILAVGTGLALDNWTKGFAKGAGQGMIVAGIAGFTESISQRVNVGGGGAAGGNGGMVVG